LLTQYYLVAVEQVVLLVTLTALALAQVAVVVEVVMFNKLVDHLQQLITQ
jgi:hypothetical protein